MPLVEKWLTGSKFGIYLSFYFDIDETLTASYLLGSIFHLDFEQSLLTHVYAEQLSLRYN